MAKKTDPAVPPARTGHASQYVGAVGGPTVRGPEKGVLRPRGQGKMVQDQPKGVRTNTYERLGSQLRVVPNFHSQSSIEAQYTQASGRVVPPKIIRSGQRGGFNDGAGFAGSA